MRKPDPLSDAFATAAVLAWRLPMLGMMAFDPSPRRRAEAIRMVVEKCAALAEAMVNVQAELTLTALGHSRPGAIGVANVALAPARRRLKANARRLKRRSSL